MYYHIVLILCVAERGTQMKTVRPKQSNQHKLASVADPWLTGLPDLLKQQLNSLIENHGVSLGAGDLQLIEGKWYVTHAGLLRLARRNRCSGIQTEIVSEFCDARAARWVVKAVVYKTPRSKGFVGYGDADPTNVSSLVRGAEMRVAEA